MFCGFLPFDGIYVCVYAGEKIEIAKMMTVVVAMVMVAAAAAMVHMRVNGIEVRGMSIETKRTNERTSERTNKRL